MNNYTVLYNGYPRNLDFITNVRIRIVIFTVSVCILFFNGISLTALNRTTHTPRTARFLATALLVFDFLALFMYTVRKLLKDGHYNLLIQMLALGWSFVAYVNIAIMSLERLLVIQWPNLYLRRFSFSKFRTASLTLWTILLVFYFVYIVVCFERSHTEVDIRACYTPMVYKYIQLTIPSSGIISCLCLGRIVCLIRRHRNKNTALPNYKSTIIVFLCCINYLVTAIFYVVILLVTLKNDYGKRVYMDIVMCLNALADSCVYVWWFKECRLEILKLLSMLFPTLDNRIEKMRMEIFNIITYPAGLASKTSQPIYKSKKKPTQDMTSSLA